MGFINLKRFSFEDYDQIMQIRRFWFGAQPNVGKLKATGRLLRTSSSERLLPTKAINRNGLHAVGLFLSVSVSIFHHVAKGINFRQRTSNGAKTRNSFFAPCLQELTTYRKLGRVAFWHSDKLLRLLAGTGKDVPQGAKELSLREVQAI